MFYLERAISVEEKIRRAEEIYNRRKGNENRNTARVNLEKKRNTSALKKMRNQIIVCILIYFAFYGLANNNFIFSEELKSKVNEILSYEVDFKEIYSKICSYFDELKFELIKENEQDNNKTNGDINNIENNNEGNNNPETISPENNNPDNSNKENTNQENNNAGSNDISQNNLNLAETNGEVPIENSIGGANEENINEEKELTEEEQMKKDAKEIKDKISFIVPVKGTITSKYGVRDPEVSTVSKYHTGLDIGAIKGTDIVSATDGKVILSSTTGDYGNHLKIENDDIIIIYAHCSKLIVNEGEEIKQGQKIAEVGSTGNSTGPHLHFEIRRTGRYIDPQLILDI